MYCKAVMTCPMALFRSKVRAEWIVSISKSVDMSMSKVMVVQCSQCVLCVLQNCVQCKVQASARDASIHLSRKAGKSQPPSPLQWIVNHTMYANITGSNKFTQSALCHWKGYCLIISKVQACKGQTGQRSQLLFRCTVITCLHMKNQCGCRHLWMAVPSKVSASVINLWRGLKDPCWEQRIVRHTMETFCTVRDRMFAIHTSDIATWVYKSSDIRFAQSNMWQQASTVAGTCTEGVTFVQGARITVTRKWSKQWAIHWISSKWTWMHPTVTPSLPQAKQTFHAVSGWRIWSSSLQWIVNHSMKAHIAGSNKFTQIVLCHWRGYCRIICKVQACKGQTRQRVQWQFKRTAITCLHMKNQGCCKHLWMAVPSKVIASVINLWRGLKDPCWEQRIVRHTM